MVPVIRRASIQAVAHHNPVPDRRLLRMPQAALVAAAGDVDVDAAVDLQVAVAPEVVVVLVAADAATACAVSVAGPMTMARPADQPTPLRRS